MIFVALVIALALACVAALQFGYMIFLQTVTHHDRRRMEELEMRLRRTERELALTRRELEQAEERLTEALQRQKDVWPEIIDG
jgi:hypothetical protein